MKVVDEPSEATPVPSKSQRKRDHHALQELAAELAALPESRLSRLELDPELREAIRTTRTMRASGARNRQLRHLAQQLLQGDPRALRTELDRFSSRDRAQVAREQRAAMLRDRVLEKAETAPELGLDTEGAVRLAELRRTALAGTDATRARHARREIYRLILARLEAG